MLPPPAFPSRKRDRQGRDDPRESFLPRTSKRASTPKNSLPVPEGTRSDGANPSGRVYRILGRDETFEKRTNPLQPSSGSGTERDATIRHSEWISSGAATTQGTDLSSRETKRTETGREHPFQNRTGAASCSIDHANLRLIHRGLSTLIVLPQQNGGPGETRHPARKILRRSALSARPAWD
jgi:hypothetical protein